MATISSPLSLPAADLSGIPSSPPNANPSNPVSNGASGNYASAGSLSQSTDVNLAQRVHLSNQGAVQIQGLSVYRQDDTRWADKPYQFNSIFGISRPIDSDPARNVVGHVGCTITALTNILNWSDPGSNLTPQDANLNRPKFTNAYARTHFTDLTGKKPESNISSIKPPIGRASAEGIKLESSIKQAIRRGHPVLLGFRGGNGGTYPRHTVVAAGLNDKGQIMVVDNWQSDAKGNALYTTLDQAMDYHGKATGFDMAQEARSRVREH
jgi:Peptidase_C39 like family